MKKHKLIGELLVKSGVIVKEQIDEALQIQKKSNKRIGEILMEMGYLKSRDLIKMLSEQAAIPFIELRLAMLDAKLIKSFPERLLYKNNIIPLYEIEDKIHIAVGDPSNREIVNKLKNYTDKEIILSGAEPKRIVKLLDRFFLVEEAEKFLENS